jgi:hypothetical protein
MKAFFSFKASIQLFGEGVNKPEASIVPIFAVFIAWVAEANN